jgi:hypothetical protein
VFAKQVLYHLSHTSSSFGSGYFWDGVSWTIFSGWPWTMILPISASQAAKNYMYEPAALSWFLILYFPLCIKLITSDLRLQPVIKTFLWLGKLKFNFVMWFLGLFHWITWIYGIWENHELNLTLFLITVFVFSLLIIHSFKNIKFFSSQEWVAQGCYPNTWGAEAGELRIQSQLGPHSKSLSQK